MNERSCLASRAYPDRDLGLDLDREVIEAIPAYLERWGTHPSWSRMLGSPALYRQIETSLTELLGSADSLLLPTLTHIHASVIPVLASDGTSRARPGALACPP